MPSCTHGKKLQIPVKLLSGPAHLSGLRGASQAPSAKSTSPSAACGNYAHSPSTRPALFVKAHERRDASLRSHKSVSETWQGFSPRRANVHESRMLLLRWASRFFPPFHFFIL